MHDLHRALGDISSIRRQMARSAEFHGYGPATLACTSLLACAAAGAQTVWVPDPAGHMHTYLAVWVATAALSAGAIALEAYARTRRIHTGMADEMLRMAVAQFMPALIAGALLTVVLLRAAPTAAWMLPGLWMVVASLGIFASCRFLPRAMHAAGAWYLACGLLCLALGDTRALEPWAMGGVFGCGQMLVAAVVLHDAKGAVDEV